MKGLKKRYLCVFLFVLCTTSVSGQDLNFNEDIRRLIENSGKEKTNDIQQDSASIHTIQQTDVLKKDSIVIEDKPVYRTVHKQPLRMSQEALYWSRHAEYANPKFNRYVTFKDTIIVNPIFMPALFKAGNVMPIERISFYTPGTIDDKTSLRPLYDTINIFEEYKLKRFIENLAYRFIQRTNPGVFRHSAESLPIETIQYISKKEEVKLSVETKGLDPTEYDAPIKFIPDRKYWTSSFESSIKFSENYASENWYKGGTGKKPILNIFAKNQFQYNYAKGSVELKNLLEANANAYSAPSDTLRDYKIGDDLLRFYSNFGYKAYKKKWYYTFDAEFKTQMFTNYKENSKVKQAAFLSPYTVNLGVGMKYNLEKKYKRKDRSLVLAVNIAPLSYTYMYSAINKNIDLNRHGFEKDEETGEYKRRLSKLGSTVRFDMILKPNRDVTWKSRIHYFTSYDRVVGEFENSLDFALSRFFSTLIYFHARFDDGVTKTESSDSYFQFNQILSFGFNYKW